MISLSFQFPKPWHLVCNWNKFFWPALHSSKPEDPEGVLMSWPVTWAVLWQILTAHGDFMDRQVICISCPWIVKKTGEKEICLGSVELWRCMKGLEFGVIIWYHLQLCPYHIASQARSPLQGIEPRPHRNGIEKMCETFCFSYARSMVPWPIWNDGFSFNPPSHRSLRLALRLQWTQHFCFAVVSPGHKYHVALVQVDNPKQS